MGESRDAKPTDGALPKTEGDTPGERDKEATSSETLGEVEESEKVSGGGSGSGSGSSDLEGSSPRPSTGGGGGRADGSDTGGPM
ncbi:MAG TPA: hypothetical protein VFX96_13295 [Pyrinomonadaceae bacterium]|nr:hypothetical protein [Pyrinomonadaceae bacterium]